MNEGVWIRDWKGTGLACDGLTPGLSGLSLINQQILWTIVFKIKGPECVGALLDWASPQLDYGDE
jgi:hypothetical protein